MKNKILSFSQIIANLLCVPIYFINFIVGIGHLPTENGDIVEKKFYHSPFENLMDMECGWLMYASFALIAGSVIISIISLMKKENTKLRKTSLIVSVISVIFAALAILFFTTVGRGY